MNISLCLQQVSAKLGKKNIFLNKIGFGDKRKNLFWCDVNKLILQFKKRLSPKCDFLIYNEGWAHFGKKSLHTVFHSRNRGCNGKFGLSRKI